MKTKGGLMKKITMQMTRIYSKKDIAEAKRAAERLKMIRLIKFWKKILNSNENSTHHNTATTELTKLYQKIADSYKGASKFWNGRLEKWQQQL
jgi:hypothetical protein